MTRLRDTVPAAPPAIEGAFSGAVAAPAIGPPKRSAPFCLRLTDAERTRLVAAAGGEPLGTYIKSRLFADSAPVRRRRPAIPDKEAFAKALALLGRSHVSGNLNQLAKAVNIGSLPLTAETEAELLAAIRDVRNLRVLLMQALGLKPEGAQ